MHPNFERPFTLDRVVRIVIGALILIGLFLLIQRLSGVLIPFLIAWLIAYLLFPFVKFLQNKLLIKNRFIATAISLILVTSILSGIGYLLIKPITSEVAHLTTLITNYAQGNYDNSFFPDNWEEWFRNLIKLPEIQNLIHNQDWGQLFEQVFPTFWKIFSGGINAVLSVFVAFIILLYIIFILRDYEALSSGWIGLLPQKYRVFTQHLADDLEEGMNRYFRGQALIALIVGVLFATGFFIIGLPLGIVLGLLIGLLNLVPYLQTIGIIPLALMALLKSMETGQSFWMVMGSVAIVFAIVQGLQESVLIPRIQGKNMGLNPAVILLSLTIWGALLGLVGMIIALPVTTLLIAYYRRYVLYEQTSENPFEDSDQKAEE